MSMTGGEELLRADPESLATSLALRCPLSPNPANPSHLTSSECVGSMAQVLSLLTAHKWAVCSGLPQPGGAQMSPLYSKLGVHGCPCPTHIMQLSG